MKPGAGVSVERPMRPIIFICALLPVLAGWAAESLSQRIDKLIAAKAGRQPLAEPASDSEFLRRVYLDFTGQIPTAEGARKFLANPSADKRAKLIDQLFADARWAETMADRFHVLLMERRGEEEEWRKWLVASFKANKPWDAMAREMLAPEGTDAAKAGAWFFITKRLEKYGQNPTDHPGLTRDVGRMFMGVDLQCAQCHRHLTVKDYKQLDFQGLYAAYSNLRLQNPNDTIKVKWAMESLLKKEMEFGSVFSETKKTTGPRVPFGVPITIPEFKKGEEWAVKPDKKKGVSGRLKFSPLREIATRMATPENPYFARNIANRAWFLMMGRGLIEPLDLTHTKNPPSHPELLDLLAKELVAHKFDLKWLFRELARTQTYQRSSVLPKGGAPEHLFASAKERPIAAEPLLRSVLLATGERDRVTKLDEEDAHSLKSFGDLFQGAFANAPREPELAVTPTLKAALFLRNNEALLWLVQRREGNLVDRLIKLKEPAKIANEAFLTLLARNPSDAERAMVKSFLQKQPTLQNAVGDLVWALLSSTEFFVNH
ncbi:MAG TPA: DUF1553 domain-containing protein [Verrucomicrobiales bacterium]|nr:DUF1553 domain-containing protein [Verrucomicrobiales bacterium]